MTSNPTPEPLVADDAANPSAALRQRGLQHCKARGDTRRRWGILVNCSSRCRMLIADAGRKAEPPLAVPRIQTRARLISPIRRGRFQAGSSKGGKPSDGGPESNGRLGAFWKKISEGKFNGNGFGPTDREPRTPGLGLHPAGYQVAAIANFTGNGIDGVLWYDPANGNVDEWVLNNNGQWATSVDLGTHPGNFQIAGTGSFVNGNSTSDILWRSAS